MVNISTRASFTVSGSWWAITFSFRIFRCCVFLQDSLLHTDISLVECLSPGRSLIQTVARGFVEFLHRSPAVGRHEYLWSYDKFHIIAASDLQMGTVQTSLH